MKKTIAKLLISILCASIASESALAQMRIVCIGNSITQGNGQKKPDGSYEVSYRPWLWDKLKGDGMNAELVGYCTSYFGGSDYIFPTTSGSPFINKSEGYYGINSTKWLEGDSYTAWTGGPLPKFVDRMNNPTKGYTPDFALIHLGTNDDDAIVATTESNIKETIRLLRVKNPNVVILLAKLITGWKPINKEIDRISAETTTAQSPVVAVDLATGFINDPGLPGTMTYDYVHPNQIGQLFMMRKFYTALLANLNDKVKPTLKGAINASSITTSTASLNWTLGTDNYGIKTYEIYANGKLLVSLGAAKIKLPYMATSLMANTNYEMKLVTKDFSGNASDTIKTTFKTLNTPAANEALDLLNTIVVVQNENGSTLTIQNAGGCYLEMIGIHGQTLLNQTITHQNESIVLPPFSGQYFVKITNIENQYMIRRFIKLK